MPEALLETKLHPPPLRRSLVARPRLSALLEGATEARLTLLSAPPGFGKSTLLAELFARSDRNLACAWLSLDAADADPSIFWSYFLAAIERAVPVGIAARTIDPLHEASMEAVLAGLINDLAAVERDVVLVLDDYHVVDGPALRGGMTFLVEHLPRNVHLVLATRSDPSLPLARLRARGELLEIRAADLRFSPDEAAAYLNETMGLTLDRESVLALEARTEGWIAALQLAALSMRGRPDLAAFVASFTGNDRYVVDYLADEVLREQTPDVRQFLLETAVLNRLTASLCDAVTGRAGSRTMLERLERDNLFVVALDDRRVWFRYHQLFADVLRARLLEDDPSLVPDLHRRASEWYERNGEPAQAVEHALAGEDYERAATLIERQSRDLGRVRAEATLRRWLEALPESTIRSRPLLAANFASVLMQVGEPKRVGRLLAEAEASLAQATHDDDDEATQGELRRLPANLALLRSAHARLMGDLPGTISNAERAMELAPAEDHLTRGGAASLIGLTRWETGDLERAYDSFAAGMASLAIEGFEADVVGGQVTLADIRIAQGRLGDGMRAYREGLDLATPGSRRPVRGAADMHVGISDVLLQRNDLAGAREHLVASRELGDDNGLPKNPYRWRLAEARLRFAEGDAQAALELLDAAERVFFADFAPVVASIPAIKARWLIAQGRIASARSWADRVGIRASDEATYVRQFELATLARVLLAEGRADEALSLAERLSAPARERGWIAAAIDALIVKALCLYAIADRSGALASLATAFEPAATEGYVRVFAEEGAPMAALLREAASRRVAPEYVSLLQAALATGKTRREGLAEPLSDRELEVLRLLATELSGPQIAELLVVSLHTVRSHTKAVFAKLGVNSRQAAVRRASELDLLTTR